MINLRSVAALVIVAEIINGVSKVKSILLAVVFSVLAGCATYDYSVVPPADRGHELVVELKGKTKAEIFEKAHVWFGLTFVSANDVVQHANPKTGRLIGSAINTIYLDGGMTQVPQKYRYRIIVDAKDGKARIRLGDYTHAQYGNEPEYGMYVKPLNSDMRILAARFAVHMNTGSEKIANDDW